MVGFGHIHPDVTDSAVVAQPGQTVEGGDQLRHSQSFLQAPPLNFKVREAWVG